MRFEDFCALHGLLINNLIEGRWVRVPTTDHPKKRNGAYKFLGDVGFVQNHAMDSTVSTWRPDEDAPKIDRQQIAQRAAEFERNQKARWDRASNRASQLLTVAKPAKHGYLMRKGFKETLGLVLPDDVLMVPMRNMAGALVGAQLIRWLTDEFEWEKKMLPGMRARGAVFRLGPKWASKTILCEGYATGLSIEMAARTLRLNAAVLVCFSDSNMVAVTPSVQLPAMVFADNDASGAGERAARATGLPYCMSEAVGEDANDIHQKHGLYTLCSLLVNAREPVS